MPLNGIPKVLHRQESIGIFGRGAGSSQCVEFGIGVRENMSEARRWYEKAAEGGQTDAMWNLGGLYEKGAGGPKNLTEARRWYEKAAALGHKQAEESLRKLQR